MAKQLVLLNAKKQSLFERVNRLYEKTKNTNLISDPTLSEIFLADTETIDEVKLQFVNLIDEINLKNLTANNEFVPDFQEINALEDLVSRIKYTRSRIISFSASKGSSANTNNDLFKNPVQLPPIEIPSFDGKQENWSVFYETFKANIHLNTRLTDAHRIQYLMGKLTHSALKITSGIVPTGENYSVIWDSLVKKYQDVRVLGTHYLNNIFDIKAPPNNATSLNTFVEKISSSVAALKQLKLPDLTDFMLLSCTIKKLDIQIVQSFEMSVRDTEIPTYTQLIDFLKDQVKILERTSRNVPTTQTSVQSHSQAKASSRKTYQSFVSNNSDTNKVCPICNKNDHFQLYKCLFFKNMPVSERFELIKSKHGCVNCLSLTHTVSACKSFHTCKHCRKRHSTLLHFNEPLNSSFTNVGTVNNTENVKPLCSCILSPDASSSDREPVSHASAPVSTSRHEVKGETFTCTASNSAQPPCNKILLSTAQVYAYANSSNRKTIRCLIDNGSQSNLITTNCCKNLNLAVKPLNNSIIKGVGSNPNTIRGYTY